VDPAAGRAEFFPSMSFVTNFLRSGAVVYHHRLRAATAGAAIDTFFDAVVE